MAGTADQEHKLSKAHQSSKRNTGCVAWIRRYGFLVLLLLATVFGYGLGLILKSYHLNTHTVYLIGFPGQLMLRAFLMLIVPLLFCSLVLGVSSLRKGGDARMVAVTIGFFLSLSTLSAIMGVAAGHLVHPGRPITSRPPDAHQLTGRKGALLDSILDLFWNSVPSNIIESTFTKEFTHIDIVNSTNNSQIIYKKSMQKGNGVNFMGLLSFSILFGCALASLGEKGDALHQVIEQLNAVIMKLMNYFLKLLPLGMFFWMFREGLESEASVKVLEYMGVFMATAFACIAFHQFILLPVLYIAIVRRNPIRYHLNLMPAILTAFGTASSAVTLPATVRCAEEVNRVHRCVTRFVLPLGMVVHMNGGTFYQGLSAVFLSQLEGINLGAAETVMVCVTSLLLGIAAPATANNSNPIFLLTVTAAGGITKPQFISLVLSVDWLMERFRTVMNVVADSYVAAFVEKICARRLPLDEEDIDYPEPIIYGFNE